MAKDENQYWIIKTPDGVMRGGLSSTRKMAIIKYMNSVMFVIINGNCHKTLMRIWKRSRYRRGWRCVKVWVYEEPRENCEDCGVNTYRPAGCKSEVRG